MVVVVVVVVGRREEEGEEWRWRNVLCVLEAEPVSPVKAYC